MSFDKFLLAVESRDLSQADKSNIRVSSFPKLCDGQQNCKLYKKNYLALCNLAKFGQFYHSRIEVLQNYSAYSFLSVSLVKENLRELIEFRFSQNPNLIGIVSNLQRI